MTWLALSEVEQITGGRWQEVRPPEQGLAGVAFNRVSLRPRTVVVPMVQSFCYGVPLQGLDAGDLLSGCVVLAGEFDSLPEECLAPVLRVTSVRAALAELARHCRAKYKGQVFGVTGSVGKTTTAKLLEHVLSRQGACSSNGNFNIRDGVVAHVAGLGQTDFTVVEVAVSGMRFVAEMVSPHVAIITALAPAHLESYGSLEVLADSKAELFSRLALGGVAIINRDIPLFDRVFAVAKSRTERVVTYGEHPEADVRLLRYDFARRRVDASVHCEQVQYRLGMRGRHMALNSLAVLAAVQSAGLDWRLACDGFADVETLDGRGRFSVICIDDKRVGLIDDAYNANPASMRAAFSSLSALRPRGAGRRIAILADMLELGPDASRYHEQLLSPLVQAGIDKVYAVGEMMQHLWSRLPETMRGGNVAHTSELLDLLRPALLPGDVLLFKGSHGTKLFKEVRRLRQISADRIGGLGEAGGRKRSGRGASASLHSESRTMRLLEVSIRSTAEAIRLVGLVERDRESTEVYFEFPARYRDFVLPSADPFAAAMLVPAQRAGQRLEIIPPISPQLLFNLPRIRDIFHVWYPKCRKIEIEATPRAEGVARPKSGRAATFFSGGVDSFYTLLKYCGRETLPAALTHAIFMRGVENKLERARGLDETQRRVEEVAAALGVECITGETNIRVVFPLDWDKYHAGSGLAATALALSGGFGWVCIPSTCSYNHLEPYGTHPLVDEKFSSEHLQIVHDGAEVTRAEKVARIVEWDRQLTLRNLRVCVLNRGGDYNCGRCSKCVRTSIALTALGLLDEAQAFPNKATEHWARVVAKDQIHYLRDNLALVRERGADPHLLALLDGLVKDKRQRNARKALQKPAVEAEKESVSARTVYPGPCEPLKIGQYRSAAKCSILFLGDTAFGENYQARIKDRGGENVLDVRGYDYPLANMRELMVSADLAIANLETPLTSLERSPFQGTKSYVHWGDVELTPAHLKSHNVGAVSLANNHTFDFGPAGFDQTVQVLERAGLIPFGAGRNLDAAMTPLSVELFSRDRPFKLAVFGAFERWRSYDEKYGCYADSSCAGLCPLGDAILDRIRALKSQDPSVFVVAYPHWGDNYRRRAATQVRWAKALSSAGADLIFGHGAHMLQEVELIGSTWVVYGLGNFVFNSPGRYAALGVPPYSLIAELVVRARDELFDVGLRLYPILSDNQQTGYCPRFLKEEEFEDAVRLLQPTLSTTDSLWRWASPRSLDGRLFLELPLKSVGENGSATRTSATCGVSAQA